MAVVRQIVEEFGDDLDGSKAADTVKFSFDGRNYLIDLSKRNATAFAKVVTPYIEAGRKIPVRRTARGRASSRTVDLAAVRAWAAEQGIAVASHGRVPTTVLKQYTAAS